MAQPPENHRDDGDAARDYDLGRAPASPPSRRWESSSSRRCRFHSVAIVALAPFVAIGVIGSDGVRADESAAESSSIRLTVETAPTTETRSTEISPIRWATSGDRDAEIDGILRARRITLDAVDATIEEVGDALAEGLGVAVLIFVDGPAGVAGGFEAGVRRDLRLESLPTRTALDEIARRFAETNASWQIFNGRVEIAPLALLARPATHRVRAIRADDQFFDLPANARERATPEVAAARILELIADEIDPAAWELDEPLRRHRQWNEESENPLSRVGRWVAISVRDGTLMVTAPPFIQRRIGTDPPPVRPADDGLPRTVHRTPPAVEDENLDGARADAPAEAPVTLRKFVPSRGADRSRHDHARARAGNDTLAARALGRLMHSRVDVHLSDTAVEEAIAALNAATGADVRMWWRLEDGTRPGLDPARRLTLKLENVSGLVALQTILDFAHGGAQPAHAPTWQIVGTRVEAGARSVLARDAARRTAIHAVDDLLIDIPYFAASSSFGALGGDATPRDIRTPLERRHGARLGVTRDHSGARRKTAEYRAAELLIVIAAQIEPLAWIPDAEDDVGETLHRAGELDDPLRLEGGWATARFQRGRLILRAPDFVLRQIEGVPNPPSPADDS